MLKYLDNYLPFLFMIIALGSLVILAITGH